MLKQEEIEKIERYIKGISDNSEKVYIESLFLKGESNINLKQFLEKDWDFILKDTSQTEVDLR